MEKEELLEELKKHYKIDFGELKFVFQFGKIYEIIHVDRERIFSKKD